MAVNNEFCFSLEGRPNDILGCMKVISNKMSATGLTIDGEWFSLLCNEWDKIELLLNFDAESEYHAVSGCGPYGRFELLDYCSEVIKDMLTQYPDVKLNGEVHSDSCVDGSQRILAFEYKDRHLQILDSAYFAPFDDDGYLDYVQSVLSYKQFLKLFSIDPDEFEEDEYFDLITDMMWHGEFEEYEYDDFCDEMPVELTERQFNNRMKKFKDLQISTYDEWLDENNIDIEPPRNTWYKWEYDI